MRKIFDVYVGGSSLGYVNGVGKFQADDLKAGELISYVGSTSGVSYFPAWMEENNQCKEIEFAGKPYPTFRGTEPLAV